MQIEALFDARTSTLTYVVWDEATRDAVIIDPVLDFDPVAVQVFDASLRAVHEVIAANGLKVRLIVDTHAHADHLSGASQLRADTGAPIAIGAAVTGVQAVFRDLFGWGDAFPADGSQWDLLVRDGDTLQAGALTLRAIHTPGHTPACTSYLVGDALFTGDALFLPDSGTGRCDFPGGSATQLYDSVRRLYALPDDTRVFVGHDYQPGGRELRWQTTIGACKRTHNQLDAETARDAFVAFREARDLTLRPPNLIFQSLQVNVRAGALPDPSPNGRRYLTLPMNVFARDT